MNAGRTMYAKICDAHTVRELSDDGHILLYIDQRRPSPRCGRAVAACGARMHRSPSSTT